MRRPGWAWPQQQARTSLDLQLQALKQWDGHLPTYTGSAGPLPFIGVTPGANATPAAK
jgi:hypothetical protein